VTFGAAPVGHGFGVANISQSCFGAGRGQCLGGALGRAGRVSVTLPVDGGAVVAF